MCVRVSGCTLYWYLRVRLPALFFYFYQPAYVGSDLKQSPEQWPKTSPKKTKFPISTNTTNWWSNMKLSGHAECEFDSPTRYKFSNKKARCWNLAFLLIDGQWLQGCSNNMDAILTFLGVKFFKYFVANNLNDSYLCSKSPTGIVNKGANWIKPNKNRVFSLMSLT